jgi:hypothetical protein
MEEKEKSDNPRLLLSRPVSSHWLTQLHVYLPQHPSNPSLESHIKNITE